MKKFLIKIFLFFIAITILDFLFGIACQYMNSHSKGGGVKSRFYVCKESKEDVLVFGSSRAKHHYVPNVIEDSLGLTCYNTGEDGNGIIYCYGVLKMITQRYKPKMIIYDVSEFDVRKDDNTKYLDLLKAYYDEPGIDSIFWFVEPKTRLMMLSSLYRYNTTCLRLFGNFIYPVTNYSKGYSALRKTMDYEPEIKGVVSKEIQEVDEIKIYYFEQFIKLVKLNNIELICCVSPFYHKTADVRYCEQIIKLCNKYEIPFYNFGTSSLLSQNKQFFNDRNHLNDTGAHFYTTLVVNEINRLGNIINNNKNERD